MSKYECAKCGSGFDDGDRHGSVQPVRLDDGTTLCAVCNKVRTKVPAKVYADVHAATLMASTPLDGVYLRDLPAVPTVYTPPAQPELSDDTVAVDA